MIPDRTGPLRIIDANLNRAGEALRVIEDQARFILQDADFAAAAKALRHAVRSVFVPLSDALLASRDAESDPGRELRTAAERTRDGSDAVLDAAFGRLTEALRSIAEHAKQLDGDRAAVEAIEAARFRGYALHQAMRLRAQPRSRLRAARLYVILTAALCRNDWQRTAVLAMDGGADVIQLREKSLGDAELLRRAKALRELTTARGALLIINDRPDIAALCGADGVHVGRADLPVSDVRRILGPRGLVGVSVHNTAELADALPSAPDYIAVGAIFSSGTKPQVSPAGPALISECRERTELPLVAIGGLTPENAPLAVRAGADILCACSAVISAASPRDAAAALRCAIEPPAAAPQGATTGGSHL
ncbi:MAG: thiamine phosphate synthase [Phycisphaerales bacterium]|nr:thiamine phosphate synthase [Phycisphaerales bacterium]